MEWEGGELSVILGLSGRRAFPCYRSAMIFRTEEQKHDLTRSWHRSDRPFFAAGACHVLAAAFLEVYPNAGFHPFLILPGPGLRGSHVFVSDGETVFDYHGFSGHDRFLS